MGTKMPGSWYHFDGSGKMQTGLAQRRKYMASLADSGVNSTGWSRKAIHGTHYQMVGLCALVGT